MSISEAVGLFIIEHVREEGLSHRTEDNYLQASKSLQKVVGDKHIAELSYLDVRKWTDSLKNQGCTAGTIRGYKSRIKNVLKFTNKKKITDFDLDLIKLNKLPKRLPEYVTPDEVSRMLACTTNVRDKMIIAMLFSVGLRVSELADANRRDIRGNIFFVAHGKGDKQRQIPLNNRTLQRLNTYLATRTDNMQPLIITRKKCRITAHTIQNIVNNAKEQAGIDRPVSPRILRHSFATDIHSNGVDIRLVQHFMGHADISTTQIYTHIIDHKAINVLKECQTVV